MQYTNSLLWFFKPEHPYQMVTHLQTTGCRSYVRPLTVRKVSRETRDVGMIRDQLAELLLSSPYRRRASDVRASGTSYALIPRKSNPRSSLPLPPLTLPRNI